MMKGRASTKQGGKNLLKILIVVSMFVFSILTLVACGESGTKKVTAIRVEQSSLSLVVGASEQLTISVEPTSATNAKLFYSSSDSSVVSVSQSGLVTALAVGEARITISAESGGASVWVPVEVIAEPVQLTSPQNVAFDGEKIVWDRVDHNRGYEITLNGVPYSQTVVTNFFTQFDVGVEYVVSVRALGDEKAYISSESSEDFTFMQYNTPTISIDAGVIQITPNSDCTVFEVLLNGQTHRDRVATTSYIIEDDLEVGLYVFEVRALGNASNNTYSSNVSNAVTVTKLSAPTNAQIEDKILTFSSITGAQGYGLRIVNIETQAETIQVIDSDSDVVMYDLGSGYEAGQYNIYIKAIGDKRTTLDSSYSTEFAVDKLSKPTNLKMTSGVLSWDSVQNATGYVMNINFNGQTYLEENIPMPTFEFASKYKEAGDYTIQIMATGGEIGGVNRFINSTYSDIIVVTKLNAPSNVAIKTDQITWGQVVNSTGYVVMLNDSRVLPIRTANYASIANTEDQEFIAGNYNARVKAIGDGENIIDSEYSAPYNFKKLSTIKTEYVTIVDSTILWQPVEDTLVYNVYINGATTPISVSENSISFSNETYLAGEYSIAVQAVSTANNAVSGEKSGAINFTKLPAPSSFRIESGVLYYSMPELASYLGYNLKIGQNVYSNINDEFLNFDSFINDDETVSVSLQARGDGQSTITSNFSEPIVLHKVSSDVKLAIENGVLGWERVDGAKEYEISITFLDDESNVQQQTMAVSIEQPNMLNLMTTPLFSNAGLYTISMRVIGTTSDIALGSGIVYDVTSKASVAVSTRKLADINELLVSSGVIVWESVSNVVYYEVILDGRSLGNCGNVPSYAVSGTATEHTVRVLAHGNQSTILDANNVDNTKTVRKLNNVFNIKLNDSTIMWDAITDAYSYDVEIRDSENNIVAQNSANPATSYGIYGLLGGATYYVRIKANGNNENIVSGDYGAEMGAPYYELKVLSLPGNVHIYNSVLYFDYVANAKEYRLYISNTNVPIVIDAVESQTRGEFDLGVYLSGKEPGTYTLFMSASDGLETQAYLMSSYTNIISVNKLEVPVISVNTGVLSFTSVENVVNYTLTISTTSDDKFVYTIDRGEVSYIMGENFNAGTYYVSIQATGDGMRTISSEVSTDFEVIKLQKPIASTEGHIDLQVENGQLVWNTDAHASLYQVAVYRYDSVWDGFKDDPEYTVKLMPSGNGTMQYLPTGTEGIYQVSIQVIGDDDKYITSDVFRYGKNLEKLRAPDNIHISDGQVAWSNNANATNGYSMRINDTEVYVGLVTAYALTAENGYSGGMDYMINLRSVGDSNAKLSSDLGDLLNANKLLTQNVVIKDGAIVWDKTLAEKYEIVVKNRDDEIVRQTRYIDEYSCILDELSEGYYFVTLQDMGSSYAVEGSGYLNADASEPVAVYKLATPTDLHINSDYSAETVEEIMRIGYLEWNSANFATQYNVNVASEELTMANRDVTNLYINLSTLGLYVDTFTLSVTARGDEVVDGSIVYTCISSDVASIQAYKLGAPTNLSVENGVFYWDAPEEVADSDVELQYIFYYLYAGVDEEFDEMAIHPIKAGSREFQTLFGSGKYKLMVEVTGVNCIKSDRAVLDDPYIFDLFKSGDGSLENPYTIQTYTVGTGIEAVTHTALSQLEYINYLYDKCFILKEDITITQDFDSLGTKGDLGFAKLDGGYSFEGRLDGDGHYINFNSNNGTEAFGGGGKFGFVYSIGENGVVKNLNLSNFYIAGSYSTVGVVTAENKGLIDNVRVIDRDGGITSSYNGVNQESYIGGIVGYNYETGRITNSLSQIRINATNASTFVYAGGIVGYNKGTIINTQNTLITVNGVAMQSQISGTIVGGIAGMSIGDYAVIDSCVNSANIDSVANSGSSGTSYARAGGIVGYSRYEGSVVAEDFVAPYIRSSYNTGSVSVFESNLQSDVTNSKAGGIIGYFDGGTVDSCYNVGRVYIRTSSTTNDTYVGAVIGWNVNSEKSAVKNTFFIGNLGIPTSNSIPLNASEIEKVTEEQLKADGTDANAIINRLNSTYDKFVYNAGGYPKLSWQE